jgi:transposase
MLNVESRFMITDLYRKGVTISEIARRTGHDRKTIRAIVQGPIQPTPQERKAKPSKLDPFKPYLARRIQDGVLNCNKLLAELRSRGYQGSRSLIKNFVQPYRSAPRQRATVRFETPPGQQAQVDWGYFGFIEHQGQRRRLYAFVMTLGWSRMLYVEFTVSTDAACWLRGHVHAFHYFGGVPAEVLHDNLKTAVLARQSGTVHWHPRYLDFAGYYGFTPRACPPYRAQTKGKVESAVRYLRHNFWPGLHFSDLADLNRQVGNWLDLTANVRIHGTTGEAPCARWPLEGLAPLLDKPDYDTRVIVFRRSTKDCYVAYDGNFYSVPSDHAQQVLQLRADEAGQLLILDAQEQVIAEHRVVAGRNQRLSIPLHFASIYAHTTRPVTPQALQVATPTTAAGWPVPAVETRPLSWYDVVAEVAA